MEFDLNSLRSIITVVSLLMFLGLVAWAWSSRRKSSFEEAAQLPFLGEDRMPGASEPHGS